MSTAVIVLLGAYVLITIAFFIAIQFESVKRDLDTNSYYVLIAPFWFIIVLWYLYTLIKRKIKRK